jgi:ribulose-phosphate 3-epimerase
MNLIREAGASAGVAINPGTAVGALAVKPDLALCMTVNPGWGGQPFIKGSLDRIRKLSDRHEIVEVDGGVGPKTAAACAEAGATTFVAGSAVFGADEPGQAFRDIVEAVGG